MNHHHDKHEPAYSQQQELSWLAFRYVAGELTAVEAEQFEEQLATDQSAREAVAQSVELYHAVAAAEADVPSHPLTIAAKVKSTWSQRLVWLSTGAAAAAVLVVAGWNATGLWSSSPAKPGVSPDLANAWTAVRADVALADEPSRPMIADLTDAELATIAEDELALPMDTPSWMTAAVEGFTAHRPAPLDASESQPQEN